MRAQSADCSVSTESMVRAETPQLRREAVFELALRFELRFFLLRRLPEPPGEAFALPLPTEAFDDVRRCASISASREEPAVEPADSLPTSVL
mmetsp:Transcript_19705/g.59679  ORF Transcript_19705/g.59679 Transcript_19705/m.59679 type:complete len:92 (+) Transcript_19705:675-950(+)